MRNYKSFKQFLAIVVFLLLTLQLQVEKSYGYETSDALITLGLATGAGAILGLSTVSFYTEPSDHFDNILIGAGVGLIVGVAIASYSAATTNQSDEIDAEELLIDPINKELKKEEKKLEEKKKPTGLWMKKGRVVAANTRQPSINSFQKNNYNVHRLMDEIRNSESITAIKVLELRF